MPSLQGLFHCCSQRARILKLLTRTYWQQADNTDGVSDSTGNGDKTDGGNSDGVNGCRNIVLVRCTLGKKLPSIWLL